MSENPASEKSESEKGTSDSSELHRGLEHSIPVLVSWLADQGVVLTEPVRAELISGGRSNITYALVAADGRRVVLRRPPFGAVLATAHDMGREWSFISALQPTKVVVPQPLALCKDTELIGAPFYVMAHVEGLVAHSAAAAQDLTPEARNASALNLIDMMATLHEVDIDEVGLGGIAKREDHIGRQLRRWKQQWEKSICTDITLVDEVHDLLAKAVPPQVRTSIAHGDFRLGNVILSPAGEIQAVLDWELATLGDPLTDLGWLLASWTGPDEFTGSSTADAPPSVLPGFPDRATLIERYAERSGADLTHVNFYTAFAYWRSACIRGGVLTRYASGAMGDDGFNPGTLRTYISGQAEAALELISTF